MKFSWPLAKTQTHESTREFESRSLPGVKFRIRRISFGRRLELARKIRAIDRRLEYLQAGEDLASKVESAIVSAEIDRAYLDWGLDSLDGLWIDGQAATPKLLIEKGPEELTREILQAIKRECFLGEEERKN